MKFSKTVLSFVNLSFLLSGLLVAVPVDARPNVADGDPVGGEISPVNSPKEPRPEDEEECTEDDSQTDSSFIQAPSFAHSITTTTPGPNCQMEPEVEEANDDLMEAFGVRLNVQAPKPAKECRKPGNLCPDRRAPVCVNDQTDGKQTYPPEPGDRNSKGGVCCPAGQVPTGKCGMNDAKCQQVAAPKPQPPKAPIPTANACALFVAGPNATCLVGQGNKYMQCMNCCNGIPRLILLPKIPERTVGQCERVCERTFPKNDP